MPFNQFKLDQSLNQSRDIFNKYIYETSDLIAEVVSANYFASSRFLISEPERWKGSVVEVKASDGFIMILISDDGGDGTAIGGSSGPAGGDLNGTYPDPGVNESLTSTVPDGASAVGFDRDTPDYTTAGAKLFRLNNNLVERVNFDLDGSLTLTGSGVGTIVSIDVSGNFAGRISAPAGGNDLRLGTDGVGSGLLFDSPRKEAINEQMSLGSNGMQFGATATPFGGGAGTIRISFRQKQGDEPPFELAIEGHDAASAAVTNIVGGTVSVKGGDGASGSAGNADGGDLEIDGGVGFGTGVDGGIKIASNQGILGIFNAAPVAQQNGTGETVGFSAGIGTGVNDDSTFTGNVGATAYRISDIVKALKNYGLLAS